jgi:ribosomal protein S18 acetylase RimI-like enzyme
VDALARLNGQTQRLHATLYPRDFKTQVDEAELRSFLRAALARGGARWLVAEIEGSVVGYAWLEIQIRPETLFRFAKQRLFLHHLCVDGNHRRRGIAWH